MKVFFVSRMLPATNYSQYLCGALFRQLNDNLVVYADTNPANLELKGCGKVKTVWRQGVRFWLDILKELRSDEPDIVHIQHEINMYGGMASALIFPFLILMIRFLRFRILVTVHAVVEKSIVDQQFVSFFKGDSKVIRPFMVRLFLSYLYRTINLFAHRIIVHTKSLKEIYVKEYGGSSGRIYVVPHGVPALSHFGTEKERSFLYFGYITRRKGLEQIIEGFSRFIAERPEAGYKLILAGGCIPGQEIALKEIELFIEDRDLSQHILITGFVRADRLAALFSRALAVVIPARISISASGPLAQGFAYGKCVLASKIGNFLEEIEHEIDGYLVEEGEWKEAFEFVVSNAEQVAEIETNSRKKATERAWERIAYKHIKIYSELLGKSTKHYDTS